ncbi:60s acidic ribosomal protein-domain-containing protein [Annulohypoxylon moriforme]|nr:60s acidic ribosomal protein-domain-containing protein [Annulohypoxylon moriforme]
MKHLAAYLLLGLAGNSSPSASDIKEVLDSVGIEADDDRLETLISELKDKDINELIAEGSSKLASVPSGGAGGGAAAGGAAAGGAAAAEEKAEEKEEGMIRSPHFPFWLGILTYIYREGRVRRGHGLRSLRLSRFRICLRQRNHGFLGEWHENGLWRSCMVFGAEWSAFDRIGYPEMVKAKANTVLLLQIFMSILAPGICVVKRARDCLPTFLMNVDFYDFYLCTSF